MSIPIFLLHIEEFVLLVTRFGIVLSLSAHAGFFITNKGKRIELFLNNACNFYGNWNYADCVV